MRSTSVIGYGVAMGRRAGGEHVDIRKACVHHFLSRLRGGERIGVASLRSLLLLNRLNGGELWTH